MMESPRTNGDFIMQPITIHPNKPGQRFSDALAIQAGACNPIAISRSLVRAVEEVRDLDTNAICADPAVRLIVHQLAFLTNVASLNHNFEDYDKTTAACKPYVVGGTERFADLDSANKRAKAIFDETGAVVSVEDKRGET
jgi:hypothetical protein